MVLSSVKLMALCLEPLTEWIFGLMGLSLSRAEMTRLKIHLTFVMLFNLFLTNKQIDE